MIVEPPDHRPIAEIQRDLDAARDLVTKYQAEHAMAWAARREAIVKAFDKGATRAAIVTGFGVTYQYVANVLLKAGRNERQRSAIRAAQYDVAVLRLTDKIGADA